MFYEVETRSVPSIRGVSRGPPVISSSPPRYCITPKPIFPTVSYQKTNVSNHHSIQTYPNKPLIPKIFFHPTGTATRRPNQHLPISPLPIPSSTITQPLYIQISNPRAQRGQSRTAWSPYPNIRYPAVILRRADHSNQNGSTLRKNAHRSLRLRARGFEARNEQTLIIWLVIVTSICWETRMDCSSQRLIFQWIVRFCHRSEILRRYYRGGVIAKACPG